jgi:hypothetical protein
MQIGAMDGISFDPIHHVVKDLAWRGLYVEPLPDIFQKLKKNYVGHRGLRFVRTAISGHDGTVRMARIDPLGVENGLLW